MYSIEVCSSVLSVFSINNVGGAFCRYPGQEYASGSPKIPSIIYYDKNGKMRAAGAETQLDNITETAEDEGWVRVEW